MDKKITQARLNERFGENQDNQARLHLELAGLLGDLAKGTKLLNLTLISLTEQVIKIDKRLNELERKIK